MKTHKSRRIFQVAILIFVSLVCIYLFLYSSFFNIDTITVTGTEKVSETEVIKLSGLQKEINIFKIDNRLCSRSIELHPMIKNAHIIRRLPREIKINIVEREMWAIMPYNDVFLSLDPEGICIDKMVNFPEGNFCVITMSDLPEQVNLGQAVVSEGIEMISTVYEEISEENRQNISEFHYNSDKGEIIIYTLKGTEIKFGDLDRMEEKTALIDQIILMEIELEENGTGVLAYVDIRFAGQPALKMK